MSLVSEAGSRFSSALWARSVCPLVRSTRTNDVAAIGGGGNAPVGAAIVEETDGVAGAGVSAAGGAAVANDETNAATIAARRERCMRRSSGKATDYRLRDSSTVSH